MTWPTLTVEAAFGAEPFSPPGDPGVVQLGEDWDSGSGALGSTTPSFDYEAGQLLLIFGYGRRGTGDPGLTVGWTGPDSLTTWLDISVTSTGTARILARAVIPAADGSATASAAISTGQNAGVFACRVDGADLSGGLAGALLQAASGSTWSPTPETNSILIGLGGALTSGPPSPTWNPAGFQTLDQDYDGTGGSWCLIERHDGEVGNFSFSGGSNPFSGHIEIAGQVPWEDITRFVRSVGWRRGRNHELSRTAAGELDVVLTNTDRRFDPTHAAGPYYPNVRPVTPVRVVAEHAAVTYPLFEGFVEDWPPRWPPRPIDSAGDAEVEVHAVDAFKLLSLAELTAYSERVLASEPVAYWRLREPTGETVALNEGSAGEDADGTYSGPTLGTAGPLVGGSTAADFDGSNDTVDVGDVQALRLRREFTWEAWISPDGNLLNQTSAIHAASGSTGWRVQDQDIGNTEFLAFSNPGTKPGTLRGDTLDLGSWQHVAVTIDGREVRFYKNGVPHAANPQILDQPIEAPGSWDHVIGDDGVLNYDGDLAHVAIFNRALPDAEIAAHYASTFDTFVPMLSGAHIEAVLDLVGWPASERDIDAGVATILEATPSGSALEWLLSVAEDTENGLLHMTGDGKVRFVDRAALQTDVTIDATIGDQNADGVVYSGLEPRYDDKDLWSRVEVPLVSGGSVVAEDAGAVAAYGPRTLARPASLADAGDAANLAAYLLAQYKDPALRFEALDLDPFDVDARWVQVLARDIAADRLTVKRRPPGGGSAIVQTALVEGVAHEVTPPRDWTATLQLVPAHPETFWILGDATYGVMDSTTRLGY